MKRQEKAARIQAQLEGYYPDPPIPLDHRDPFTLLVAVLLSAQTTDAAVNTVTPALFEAAPTPAALAELEVEQILGYIRKLGLAPTKAKHLAGLARGLLDAHGGQVPESLEELEQLPGVGHKTASVVMAQAFGVPAFPVDTHIFRLAGRWGLSRAKNVVGCEKDLKACFPRASWGKVHLQIILFGREHCPARGHDLSTCPICSWAATKARIAEESRKKRGA